MPTKLSYLNFEIKIFFLTFLFINFSEKVQTLFKKSFVSGYINKLELENALENKYVSRIFI